MKSLITVLFLFLILIGCNSSDIKKDQAGKNSNETPDYDSVLAKQLGADDYGMKTYVMAFLKRGPNRVQDSAMAAQLQRAHLNNILKMAKEGSLVLAGPFADTGNIRGIYIFNVSTVEEARELTASDPAIKAGSLEMELHPWYGSAALMMLNDIYKKITKMEF